MRDKVHLSHKIRYKIGQFTWLFLGLCFVTLYSCPVKKFLIVHFDKVSTPGSASGHIDKHFSSQNTRIAYLNKNNFSFYKIPASPVMATPTDEPVIPDWNFLLSALLLFLGLSYAQTKRAAATGTANGNTIEGAPPLYLQLLRLQI
jgi:hypothetical protein